MPDRMSRLEAEGAAVAAEAAFRHERGERAAADRANEALRIANAELRASRAALRESEERQRLILDSATDYAIFAMDLDRHIRTWNTGAQRLLGWTREEIIGAPVDLIFTPEDREAGASLAEAEGAIGRGRAADERWHLRKDGSRFWANGLMLPLRDPEDPDAPPSGLLKIMRDETERLRAEEQKNLLLGEMIHRVKNTLAVVQSVMLQTARAAGGDLGAFTAAFQSRLIALSRAHDLLARAAWTGAPLHEVVRAALEPTTGALAGSRLELDCPSERALGSSQALAVALALHELATNALKHGALSTAAGRVSVACRGCGDALSVEWTERGGPPIARPPERTGFGLRLLQRGLRAQGGLDADLRFEPEGVRCTLLLPRGAAPRTEDRALSAA